MSRRWVIIAAVAAAVVVLAGIGWYALSRPTPQAAVPTPSVTRPSPSLTPSPTPSPTPSERPSPSGSPSLPGSTDVNPDALPALPFDVVLPANWSCQPDTAGLGTTSFVCGNSSDQAKVTDRLRLAWRQCDDDCTLARRNVLSVDWQAAWFGEIRRLVPVDADTATTESQSAATYFSALSRFTEFGGGRYHYAVVVEGPAADRTLLSAISATIRTNAG
jgi:hypothetical protein